MVFRNHCEQFFRHHRNLNEAAVLNLFRKKRHVIHPLRKLLRNLILIINDSLALNAVKAIARQIPQLKKRVARGAGSDYQFRVRPVELPDFAEHELRLAKKVSGVFGGKFPGLSEGDFIFRAGEKGRFQLILKVPERAAQRGLRYVEFFRSF